MSTTGRTSWKRTAIPGDIFAAAFALSLSGLLTKSLYRGFSAGEYVLYTVGLAIGWLCALAFGGAYEPRVELFAVEEMRRLCRAAVSILAMVAIPYFVLELEVSQRYMLIAIAALFTTTWLWRVMLRWSIASNQSRGRDQYRALVGGDRDDVLALLAHVREQRRAPIRVEQVWFTDDLSTADEDHRVVGLAVVQNVEDEGAFDPDRFDLIVRAGQPDPDELWRLTALAHTSGLPLAIAPQRHDVANVDFGYLPMNGTPLLMVETPARKLLYTMTKGVFDRAAALLLLSLLSPVLLGITVLVAAYDERPVLYRQVRVGRDGSLFRMLKFRTMVTNAHDLIPSLKEQNESDGPLFKVRNDPRVTRIGRILRRHSLDELPQLVNVLLGQMSLVGPRPPLPEEVESYDPRTARRLVVKPGITGLWQVEGRSDLSWDEGLYYDLYYVNHWSPVLDMSILIRTIGVVLARKGAY